MIKGMQFVGVCSMRSWVVELEGGGGGLGGRGVILAGDVCG
jgi:hypothetical protein